MTTQLNDSNPIMWFISFLNMIRVDILDRFVIPGLGVTYWDFLIGCAIAAVVITVLINSVRIGLLHGSGVSYSDSRDKPSPDVSYYDGIVRDRPSGYLPSPSSSSIDSYDGFGW